MRDIFTMGARPIACLDSLRFGSLDDARTRYLFDGVVRGIGDYGNCLGIPTVEGEGNAIMIVGSSTGRDGIHGATFASEEISEKSESKRPSVQVGDPFTEKLLLEASLDIIKNGWLGGMQDTGAAGISCLA